MICCCCSMLLVVSRCCTLLVLLLLLVLCCYCPVVFLLLVLHCFLVVLFAFALLLTVVISMTGRGCFASSAAAKHVLAELKASHIQATLLDRDESKDQCIPQHRGKPDRSCLPLPTLNAKSASSVLQRLERGLSFETSTSDSTSFSGMSTSNMSCTLALFTQSLLFYQILRTNGIVKLASLIGLNLLTAVSRVANDLSVPYGVINATLCGYSVILDKHNIGIKHC